MTTITAIKTTPTDPKIQIKCNDQLGSRGHHGSALTSDKGTRGPGPQGEAESGGHTSIPSLTVSALSTPGNHRRNREEEKEVRATGPPAYLHRWHTGNGTGRSSLCCSSLRWRLAPGNGNISERNKGVRGVS